MITLKTYFLVLLAQLLWFIDGRSTTATLFKVRDTLEIY